MAINKKYIDKITENNLDDWLHSTGFLYPKNEKQLERFEKLYEDYDFKLKDEKIDIDSIINDTLCYKVKVMRLDLSNEIKKDIQDLKMVARKGQNEIPQHIIDKMKKKHQGPNDKE
ncbi:hypothetical protein [Myroides odoratimimus]|uniref:hypothetical protein n=1 Tax=Myroides odoratimimus TaxID=76832 RepID=UPI003101AB18